METISTTTADPSMTVSAVSSATTSSKADDNADAIVEFAIIGVVAVIASICGIGVCIFLYCRWKKRNEQLHKVQANILLDEHQIKHLQPHMEVPTNYTAGIPAVAPTVSKPIPTASKFPPSYKPPSTLADSTTIVTTTTGSTAPSSYGSSEKSGYPNLYAGQPNQMPQAFTMTPTNLPNNPYSGAPTISSSNAATAQYYGNYDNNNYQGSNHNTPSAGNPQVGYYPQQQLQPQQYYMPSSNQYDKKPPPTSHDVNPTGFIPPDY